MCADVLSLLYTFWDPQKYALSLDVPQTWFNNWPDDDSLSRNMSPL